MRKIVITGGGGFVGKAIVTMALAQDIECTVVGRNRYPEVEALGANCISGDIRDVDFLDEAFRDVDTVFHAAALAGIWGPWSDYYSINVVGTENVLAACRKNSIPRLVYTSTPSVVFNRDDIKGGDECLPYPEMFLCNYAKSKVMAERMVLAAQSEELSVCALRPHLVWGPGDPHLIPRLLQKGKNRELKRVGDGNNLVDISYIDNVAHAHILAARSLETDKRAAGKTYFVSQGTPVKLWDWINDLFSKIGIEPITQTVPFPVAYCAGAMLEVAHNVFMKNKEPRMTRFLAEQLAKSHYFSCSAIEQDLGYVPIVSTEEGMNNLINWIQENETTLL